MNNFINDNLGDLYSVLLNQSKIGIFIVEKDGYIIDINQVALDILGSPSRELTLKINLFEFMPLIEIGFSSNLFDTFNKLIETSGESYYKTKWGKEIYLKYNIYPPNIKSKNFVKIVIEDLTEIKEIEENLKRHEKILINTFNALEDLIIVIDRDFNIITSTWEGARLLNTLGKENKCYNTFFGSDSPCKNCRVNNVFDNKETIIYEKSDNNDNFFEIKLIPILDSNGSVEAVVEHYHDISKIKRSEIKLKKLKTAIETASETIVITDSEGLIEYANPAFSVITGYTLDEAIGLNPRVLKSGLHDKKFYKELWDIITSGKIWYGIFTNKKKDGSLYQEAASISPVLNRKGVITNYIAVKRDISNEIKLQKQLVESQKMESIGIMASGIAHEINTPLQYIMDNLTFIMDNFKELKKYKDFIHEFVKITDEIKDFQKKVDIDFVVSEIPEALKDSLNGVKIIRNIINSMRTFSHKSEDKQVIDDINKHIIATTEISKNSWKNILDMKLNLSDNLPKIKVNIGKINQVILNLIVNAVDAIKDDKNKKKKNNEILISSYVKDEFLVISIKDTGSGIDESNKDKIFAPFFTTKGVGKGTGQGLSISYNIIVNEHNGSMSFESEEFKGTTFFIELPLSEV